MPTGCPEPAPPRATRGHRMRLAATKRKEWLDARPPSNLPVNTGRPATGSSEKTLEDIQGAVSERGLEPPRAKSSLGPQPSAPGILSLYSRAFEDRQDVPGLLRAISPRLHSTSEVPARVPAERHALGGWRSRCREALSRCCCWLVVDLDCGEPGGSEEASSGVDHALGYRQVGAP